MRAFEFWELCDIDIDGDCDSDDRTIVQSRLGSCEGDTDFIYSADADFDDCITGSDIPRHFPSACFGDCEGDGEVNVDELVRALNMALGHVPVESCELLDVNRDATVTVNELLLAVRAALEGCNSTS